MPYDADPARYTSTEYSRVGRSGLKLPRVSLGLWNNFGADRSLESQRAILRRAFDLGITHFDLANNYGPPYGAAEENFGRILATDVRTCSPPSTSRSSAPALSILTSSTRTGRTQKHP